MNIITLFLEKLRGDFGPDEELSVVQMYMDLSHNKNIGVSYSYLNLHVIFLICKVLWNPFLIHPHNNPVIPIPQKEKWEAEMCRVNLSACIWG